MSVLVMQLAGPLQSWGATARFARRTTSSAPTKSGVLGLLAAALGWDRSADLTELAALRFGVRVDQRGTPLRDYQTAHHAESGDSMPVSHRYYLADAVFVAAVEGEDELVDRLHRALRHPVFLPYLGRRSCPPARPVELGVHRDRTLEDALVHEPWHAAEWCRRRRRREAEVKLETAVEPKAKPGSAHPDTAADDKPIDSLRDQPLSFDPRHRRYALREVVSGHVMVANPAARRNTPSAPDHDPTAVLGGD